MNPLPDFELAPDALKWVHIAWGIVLGLGVFAWAMSRREAVLRVFGYDPSKSEGWLRGLRRRRWGRACLFACALLFLCAAAVEPRCNPDRKRIKTTARDIAVILDVSKSMLAQDLQPSRLERAKLELERLCDHLKGDRVGLITFAGDAVIKSPLTSNYSYFKAVLRTVDTRSASQGGTRIGDAIRKALSDLFGIHSESPRDDGKVKAGETVMEEEMKGERQSAAFMILITDGEDMESYPVHAAKAAQAANVGLYVVGLGSEQGSPIPIRGKDGKVEFLRSKDGEVHQSKLDSKTITEMVNACRGGYLPVGTYNFDLVEFFDNKIDPQESGKEVIDEQVAWTEIFQPFLLTGLGLYIAYLLVPERPRRGRLALQEAAS